MGHRIRHRGRSSGLLTAVLASLPLTLPAQSPSQPVEVRYPIRDSLALVADVHRGRGGPGAPAILLFHQAGGSARGEYRAITPRLLREGYHVIAADVRGGGDRFGIPGRAAATDSTFVYCAAVAEVEAAVSLARAEGFTGPLVLWGSSYTAALVLQVAARRSADVRAVLAFSPASGGPMRGCEPGPYVGWLARAGVPAMVLRPRVELADSGRLAAFETMRRHGATVLVAERGVHGSSLLDAERTGASTDREWRAVLAFLRRALVPGPRVPGDRPVSIPSDGWTLRGDLRLPGTSPAPLVVLLHKAAGSRAIFRDLATRLAAAGIGSLRVDLRGHGESVKSGRFIPGRTDSLIVGTERDIAAVWRYVLGLPGVDTARLGLVSGSYSSEAAALAARNEGFGRAQVALSPGNFSDSSFRAAAGSGASWVFVRSDDERFVREWLDAKVHQLAPGAELWVVPAGSAHATDLLAADPGLPDRIASWLAAKLNSGASAAPPAIRVTYLANEGVMLTGTGGRVLIDALFGEGLPEYPTVPAPVRDSLERALGGFGGPVAVLTTHSHRDHYDAAAHGRYLQHNPTAIALGPRPDESAPLPGPVDLGWVGIRPLDIPHGPTVRPVGHTAYLLTLDGVTALHLGDTQSEPATWTAAGVPREGVDLALVPFWYALDPARFTALLDVLRPGAAVLLHAPRPAGDRGQASRGWEEASRALRARDARVHTPQVYGEFIEVTPR